MAKTHSQRLPNWIQELPLVTLSIVALNVAVMVHSYYDVRQTAINYGLVPSQLTFAGMITSNFLHDGWGHLATNMLVLCAFGRSVERVMGRLEYLLFYVGACIIGSLIHIAVIFAVFPIYYADVPIVGASGAVAGVMGVYAVRFHRKILRFAGVELPALFFILIWLALQLVLGILGLYRNDIYISWWSHLGGFGFGIAVALLGNMALLGEREYLSAQADEHCDEGNLLAASQDYESLLKYDPDNPFAHAVLGRLWARLEEKEKSIAYYQTGIELYVDQGEEEKALAAAEEMALYWPDAKLIPATRVRLASYLADTSQASQALQAFQRIIDEHPDSPEAQVSMLRIGHLQLSSLGDRPAAIATLGELIERYPAGDWRAFAEMLLAKAEDESTHYDPTP